MYNPETDKMTTTIPKTVSPSFRARTYDIFPLMNWSSIFAGLVAGLATYILLMLMGVAAGLSAMEITAQDKGIDNVSTWTTAWNGISMLISAFVGGYVSARMSGLRRKLDGIMHGVVTWGATTLLFVVLSATATANLLGGAFNTLIQPNSPAAAASEAKDPASIANRLRSSLMPDINANALTSENLQQLQTFITNKDRQGAIEFMTFTMGVEGGQATEIVDRLMVASGSPELASPQTRTEINRTVDVASAALWILFFAVLFSAASSMAGGISGVKNVRRAHQTTATPNSTQATI